MWNVFESSSLNVILICVVLKIVLSSGFFVSETEFFLVDVTFWLYFEGFRFVKMASKYCYRIRTWGHSVEKTKQHCIKSSRRWDPRREEKVPPINNSSSSSPVPRLYCTNTKVPWASQYICLLRFRFGENLIMYHDLRSFAILVLPLCVASLTNLTVFPFLKFFFLKKPKLKNYHCKHKN